MLQSLAPARRCAMSRSHLFGLGSSTPKNFARALRFAQRAFGQSPLRELGSRWSLASIYVYALPAGAGILAARREFALTRVPVLNGVVGAHDVWLVCVCVTVG